jgi:hypothetical protein
MTKAKNPLIALNLRNGNFELAIKLAMFSSLEGSTATLPDGRVYNTVYLPNVYPHVRAYLTPSQFAGYLSSMKAKGLYRSHGDDYFGEVLTKEAD